MIKPKKSIIEVKGTVIAIVSLNEEDYICLTDIARYKDAERTDDLVRNRLRNRNTIEFFSLWERLNNPGFNPVEIDGFKNKAGLNSFVLTPRQWIDATLHSIETDRGFQQ
jgi:hypothetical protein